jgi:6-phosphogluconolactonase
VDLDWSKVSITLADERWVPPDHADSNESLVRKTLLTGHAAAARFVPLYRQVVDDAQALKQVTADIRSMHLPFCVVMLGMGADGHTASLFPDAPAQELRAAMALDNEDVVAFLHPPSVSQTRISLTRACLLDAGHRFLHITGTGKRDVLRDALTACAGGAYESGHAPVVGLLTEQPERASVYWSP